MKILLRLFLSLVIIALAFFGAIHTFVSIKGKDLLAKKLHSLFHSEVTIGRVTTSFPFNLIVKNLEVKNWFKIKKIIAKKGMLDVFNRNFVLSDLRLERVEIELEKRKHPAAEPEAEKNVRLTEPVREKAVIPAVNQSASVSAVSVTGDDFFLPQRITFKKLIISDSILTYIDYSRGETPIKFRITDLNVKLENFQWPFLSPGVVFFEINGRVPWMNIKEEEGRIEFAGWINFYKRDMRAELEIKGIDGVYIYPYYSSWVNIEKARVEKARLNFTSNITALNNDVSAASHLELTQIAFKPKADQEKEPRIEKITNVVLDLLKTMDQGKIVLDFNFKTKLDNPEFGLGIIQDAFKDKLIQSRKKHDSGSMQIIKLPMKIIESAFTTVTDLTKSVINGTVNVGAEVKKAVETSFDRENKKVPGNNSELVNQTK